MAVNVYNFGCISTCKFLLFGSSGKETSQEYNTPAALIGVGGKGITRRGRVIRSPQAFWKGIFL